MPLIITATDFSEVAENAVNYACKLAESQNARVTIIHSFIIPVMFSDIPMPATLITDTQNDAEVQMEKLVGSMQAAYPGLTIVGKVLYGDTVNALEEFAEASDTPWLVVIGNRGDDNNMNWPENTLTDVFKNLDYPVLAVPQGISYQPVKNICFAFDNNNKGTGTAVQQIKDFTAQLGAALHVLNILPAGAPADTHQADESVRNLLSSISPEYHFVPGADNIDNAIRDFNAGNNIDWLVMIPRKHSFFEGLFHKSHTKNIAHKSNIPILALHETQS